MHSSPGRLLGALLTLVLPACGDNNVLDLEATEAPLPATCDESDLPGTLAALPHVTSVAETPCGDYVTGQVRCFSIQFDQPITHEDPEGKRFSQRLFLAHRGCESPNLVGDWGYSQDYFFDDELSVLYQTNALWIEHRFQGESLPAATDWDWTALTIENGATDMHEIVDAFKQHYGGRWVSTGASKGGVTATYHKFLFPDDLDGAIPYVAPASRFRVDSAYQTYLNTTLPEPCAQRVRDVQVAALTTRRAMMLQRIAAAAGPGGEALTLEYATAHFDWAFWQYYGVEYCANVPTAASSDTVFWNFFSFFTGLSPAAPAIDETASYGALYYEWLTEQGFALQINAQITPHLAEPSALATMEDNFQQMFPGVALPRYDGSVTGRTRAWVRDQAENVLLIYGQYDPWSGGAMDDPTRPSSGRFFVPDATHGAQISGLTPDDEVAALAFASKFFGRKPVGLKSEARRAGAMRQSILDAKTRQQLTFGLRLRPAR